MSDVPDNATSALAHMVAKLYGLMPAGELTLCTNLIHEAMADSHRLDWLDAVAGGRDLRIATGGKSLREAVAAAMEGKE